MNPRALFDLLYRCTVRIEQDGHLGTGFFAAPGMVLTAAHVVDGCATVDLVWDGQRFTSQAIHRLVDPPAGGSYPWPDVAILEVAVAEHPWLPLSDEWPLEGAGLHVRSYAAHYVNAPVGGTSVSVEYVGPYDWPPGRMLRLKGDRITPGMSGSPVLDASTGRVCAVMKSTGNEESVPDGYATPLADVLAQPHPAVAKLLAARAELDPEAIAVARWGALLARAAAIVRRAGCGEALAAALSVDVEDVARLLFESDLDQVSLVLDTLLDDRSIGPEDAMELIELVGCCLPINAGPEAAWWIPPEAADQLREEIDGAEPRVAHVPTDEHATLRMLVRRASGRSRRELFGQDAHPVQTPEPDAWFNEVERVVRSASRFPENWWRDDDGRRGARKRIMDKGLVLRLPPLAAPADLEDVRSRLGAFPFVLAGRGPSPDTPRVVRIEPEISATTELSALRYLNTVRRP